MELHFSEVRANTVNLVVYAESKRSLRTTQTENGHHSIDPYFEKGQIYTRCVPRRVSLRQAAFKCFAIPSPIYRQCGYNGQARFALGGVLFHQEARGGIFRFLRIIPQQIFRNIYYLFKQQF